MNKTIKRLRLTIILICISLTMGAVIRAQNPPPNSNKQVSESQNEQPKTDADAKEFYQLTKMAPNALAAGEMEKAKEYAQELLKQAESFKKNWNYGNALHAANIVLGQIALKSGDVDEAKHFLLEAGKTPGSPQLDSFGPDMSLAKNLLEKDERETVIEYFGLCAKFWKSGGERLDKWKTAVLEKEAPDFGPNLIYFTGDLLRSVQN